MYIVVIFKNGVYTLLDNIKDYWFKRKYVYFEYESGTIIRFLLSNLLHIYGCDLFW